VSTSTRRNRPAGEVRARILDAASQLLAERVPADVTLRQIADRAGVQHSLSRRHYESKAGLVRAVVDQTASGYAARVAEGSDPADGFVQALRYLLDNPIAASAFASAQVVSPESPIAQASYPGATLHRDLLEAEAGPAARDIRIVAATALALAAGWAMLEDWALTAFDLGGLPVEAVRDEVMAMLRELVVHNADLPGSP
jgi:AcrR family transcriptional regulator